MIEDGEHGPYESEGRGEPLRNSSHPREAVVEAFRKLLEQQLEAKNPSIALKGFCVSMFAEHGDAEFRTDTEGAQMLDFAIDDTDTGEIHRGFLYRLHPESPEDTSHELRIVFYNVNMGWHGKAHVEYRLKNVGRNEAWMRFIFIGNKNAEGRPISFDLVKRILGNLQKARPDW